MKQNKPAPAPSTAEHLIAQLIFKQGRKEALVGYHNQRVALVPVELKLEKGVYYNCKLRTMKGGKGYVILEAELVEPVRVNLSFREGKSFRSGKELGGMVGSYNAKIVIVPESMEVEAGEFYSCEIVLKPKGNAYHVQKATALPPQEAVIKAIGFPVFTVEVSIGGVTDNKLGFDGSTGNSDVIEKIAHKLSYINLIDKATVIADFKLACKKILGEYKNMTYARNAKRV